jgi:prepilin-type N-terminal cleavage/methylation domain-containing protein
MQKTAIRKARKGFTLVEVALAVAVGLIIIGGAVLGYNAVKDNAANSNARDRVLTAVSMVEEYASANGGRYPSASATVPGTFTTMWKSKRPDDYNSSPWGGTTAGSNGADEATTAITGTTSAPTAATVTTVAVNGGTITVGTADTTRAADMIYAPITASQPWASITAFSTASAAAVKNYAVGIFDKNGQPFWDVKGGK